MLGAAKDVGTLSTTSAAQVEPGAEALLKPGAKPS